MTSATGSHLNVRGWIAADFAAIRSRLWSLIDIVPTSDWHTAVDGGGSTVAHLLLHLARHQDLAIATATRNQPPLFARHAAALGLDGDAPGVCVSEAEDPTVSTRIACGPLVDYVGAVFDATAEWLDITGSMVLETVPTTSARLMRHAALDIDEFGWLHRMWDERPVWWLLQWPVLGHAHAHTGELISLRNRLGLRPF